MYVYILFRSHSRFSSDIDSYSVFVDKVEEREKLCGEYTYCMCAPFLEYRSEWVEERRAAAVRIVTYS